MKKFRISFIVACAALVLASGALRAQTSIQNISLSLIGEYQTNAYSRIYSAPISTVTVIRALAADLGDTDFTIWRGAQLVRTVNLTNGEEGIYLRKGELHTNVSSYFGTTYSNNFTAGVTNAFPAFGNNISGLTNHVVAFTNTYPESTNLTIPQTQLIRGWLRRPDAADTNDFATNYLTTAGVYFISLNTTNIKFNLLAVGDGSLTNVGALYPGYIDSVYMGCAGNFYLNIATSTSPPNYVSGPLHGTFSTGQPFNSTSGP